MPSLKRHEGVLLVDHRASPGLPDDFYRKLGVDLPAVGEGQMMEFATLTCSHCKNVFVKNPLRTRERPYCAKCDQYVCDNCFAISQQPLYDHTPFEKIIDVVKGSDRQDNLPLLLSHLRGTGVKNG
jgi:hypothetical protein